MIFPRTPIYAVLVSLLCVSSFKASADGSLKDVSNRDGLTPSQHRATQYSQNWQRRSNAVTYGAYGKIIFVFGVSQPTIVCSPLRLCDLELQTGERVMNVHAGDNVRWKFDGARSGPNGAIPHVLIKPVEPGLETSLVITTNRRTYHIHLRSAHRKYMARIGFDYASDPSNMVAELNRTHPREAPPSGIPGFGSIDNLNFSYRIDGNARWKPVRVFNDGAKTYIEMPARFRQNEAPVLLVLGSGQKEALVNYRIKGRRYIVDQIFDKAILIAGVGQWQDRVTLTRSGSKKNFNHTIEQPSNRFGGSL